jgi:hypothetical protein
MSRAILVLAILLLLFCARTPARACINDREVTRSEREFKSNYLEKRPPAAPAPEYTPPTGDRAPFLYLGVGSTLLIGATVISMRKRVGRD